MLHFQATQFKKNIPTHIPWFKRKWTIFFHIVSYFSLEGFISCQQDQTWSSEISGRGTKGYSFYWNCWRRIRLLKNLLYIWDFFKIRFLTLWDVQSSMRPSRCHCCWAELQADMCHLRDTRRCQPPPFTCQRWASPGGPNTWEAPTVPLPTVQTLGPSGNKDAHQEEARGTTSGRNLGTK